MCSMAALCGRQWCCTLLWEKERGGAGPKTDMLSSAWMPSNHSSSLPLFRVFPPPPAGPSLQSQLKLILHCGCLTLEAPRHHKRLMSNDPNCVDTKGGGAELLQ